MQQRRVLGMLAAAPLILGIAACSGGSNEPDASTLTLWDGFTQYDEESPFGREIVPFTLALFRFIGAQTTDWNGVMASAVLASLPALLLLVLAQRYVAAGLTAGAVKD